MSTDDDTTTASPASPIDPVRVKRAKIAKWTLLANRVGYLFVALAMALFVMAFVLGFNSTMATLVIIAFIIGCVLLAPSIILGYAVKAAEREDRENGL
jgi:Na+/proline symporter